MGENDFRYSKKARCLIALQIFISHQTWTQLKTIKQCDEVISYKINAAVWRLRTVRPLRVRRYNRYIKNEADDMSKIHSSLVLKQHLYSSVANAVTFHRFSQSKNLLVATDEQQKPFFCFLQAISIEKT
jgi:hypothetical protein